MPRRRILANAAPSRKVGAGDTAPLKQDDIAARFTGKGAWKKRLPEIVAALAALGRAREVESGRWLG